MITLINVFKFYNRYQQKCDELTVKNGQFKAKYDQMATDMKSNESYLKKEREKRGLSLCFYTT